ncbi:MAG: 3-methyl-2-oxobutanoate hydroxymethyltransferase [Akkermansiaceae bacterium]|nr:3-methyl-2-oxobutanoate hydroxymethyltransferase [Akkermansiaceae bacterium]
MLPADKSAALRARKTTGPPIAALTAYDYPTARLLDEAGVDLLLVGDSLGMVVLGFPDTTHVTMEHMLHHTAATARGNRGALLVADLPIDSYRNPAEALANARALVDAGAEAVKLEGGVRQAGKVRAIVADGIPVLGHLGMLPQRVKEEGGYKKKGRSDAEIKELIAGTRVLQAEGCFGIVLESVLPKVARRLTAAIEIPTIGIGCGEGSCDGEIAVVTDILGSYPWFVPPFAVPRADVAGEISRAAKEYVAACQRSPESLPTEP